MTPRFARWNARLRWAVVVAAILGFLGIVSLFHVPGQGFSSLLRLGDHEQWRRLPELRELDLFVQRHSTGYDAQHYVQLALRPAVTDPELREAVDNLPYRARRIMLSWVAYALGGGEPARIVQVYALLGVAAWLGLAVLLLVQWLPPVSWGNVGRWAAILFTFGLCNSVRSSLVDGPSLLAIAGAVALLERQRSWLAAVVLGLAGLIRETNVLAAVAFAPRAWNGRQWLRAAALGLLTIAPLALWLVYLEATVGRGEDVGTRNFSSWFGGYIWAWREAWQQAQLPLPFAARFASGFVLISLTVQALFFLLRPRFTDAWWRIGMTYTVLMGALGVMVWEGVPGAAARVLLPMTLAFNLLVPRGRAWPLLLVLGNLLVIPSILTLPNNIRDIHRFSGAVEERTAEDGRWRVWYDQYWYGTEASRFGATRWRWASGPAAMVLYNPHPRPVLADVSFEVASREPRDLALQIEGETRWTGRIDQRLTPATVEQVVLPPGYSRWLFVPSGLAADQPVRDARELVFNLRRLRIHLHGPPAGHPTESAPSAAEPPAP